MIRGVNKVCIFAAALLIFSTVATRAWSHGGGTRIRAGLRCYHMASVNTLDHARDASLDRLWDTLIMARRGRGGQRGGGFGGPADEYDRSWRQRYREWESLSPERKRLLRERMQEWKRLSPKERALLRKRYEQWKSLSPEERIWIQNQLRHWKELSPEEREMIRRMFMP